MVNYLVTGGAGFIGSNLVEKLLKFGYRVTVIDDLTTGNLKNIISIGDSRIACYYPNFFISDLRPGQGLGYIPDGIFHLGIPSSTPLYRANRYLTGSAISDFITIMEYAKQNGVKVVYASSSSVYNGNPIPWREDMNLIPTDFYSEVRISMERIAKVYFDMYGVQSIGLRLFSVYGPHEEYKKKLANLISQLIWAKQKDETFEIYGNGEQARDTTYVSDVVDAFILAMANSSIKNDIFNIGTGVNYSLLRIAEMIGAKITLVKNPLINYVDNTLADTSKATSVLDFTSKIPLSEGLRILLSE